MHDAPPITYKKNLSLVKSMSSLLLGPILLHNFTSLPMGWHLSIANRLTWCPNRTHVTKSATDSAYKGAAYAQHINVLTHVFFYLKSRLQPPSVEGFFQFVTNN